MIKKCSLVFCALSFPMLFLLACTGESPYKPENATVNLTLENSGGHSDPATIADTVENLVRINMIGYLPTYIDSVKIVIGTGAATDTGFTFPKSTSWANSQLIEIAFRSAGTRTVTVTVFVNGNEKTVTATIVVIGRPVNNKPSLDVSGVRNITTAQTCSLSLSATDIDSGQTFTYAMIKAPQGATLNANLFKWTPPTGHTGTDTVTFAVTDNGKPPMSDMQTVFITVSLQITVPAKVQGIRAVSKNNGYFVFSWNKVSNADSYNVFRSADTVNFQKIGSTSDSLFGDTVRAGNFYYYVVAVNSAGSSPASAIVYSGSIKTPPLILVLADTSVSQGKTLAFMVQYVASAQDTVTLGAADISGARLPDSATFNPGTGLFTWTPTFSQLGLYKIVFTATNGNAVAKDTVKITVNKTNRPPVVQAQSVNTGRDAAITITLIANDPDNDAIAQWRLPTAARHGTATLADSTKGSVVYTPSSGFIGVDTFTVDAYDGSLWSLTSANVIVFVDSSKVAPKIQTQPRADTTVNQGGSVAFTVAINNAFPTPVFTWYKGTRGSGVSVQSGTNPSYQKTGVVAADSGNYYAVVVNASGSDTSSYAHLAVNIPPTVVTNPATTSVKCPGDSVSFAVTATGTPPLSYQWQLGGSNIASAMNATYRLTSVTSADAGSYTCIVTNAAGLDTSIAAVLTVNTASTAPAGATANPTSICLGASSSISVSGGSLGTGGTWKWYSDETCTTPISGINTGASITVSPGATTTYYVRAEGPCGNTTIASISVTVNSPSTAPNGATANPTSLCAGNSSTLSVSGGVLGTGAAWKWYTDASCTTPVSGINTGASINVSPSATTTYYVRAEGTCGNTAISSVILTVNTQSTAPTGASANPTSICSGASSSVSVTGGSLGTGASWKWYVDAGCTTPVTGTNTGATITVSPTSTTTYYVRAEGTCGNTTAASVTVTLNTASIAPSGATAKPAKINVGVTDTLSVTGGSLGTGASWKWYTNSGCTTPVSGTNTGASISVTPASTTTYYIRAEGTCGNTATASVTVTVVWVTKISSSVFNTYFVKSDSTLWACGYDGEGGLFDGGTTNQPTPIQVKTNVINAAVGGNQGTSAFGYYLTGDGKLYGCGANYFGELGDGTTNPHTTPVLVMAGVKNMAAGANHVLILKSDETVWACGSNYDGQLGDGTDTSRSTPKWLTQNVKSIAAGENFSLILDNNGNLYACGRNNYGQLGIGSTDNSLSLRFVMSNVASISAGNMFSLAVKTDGTVWGWGFNYSGQLGTGSTDSTSYKSPVQMNSVSGASKVFAGFAHSLVLTTAGALWVCGDDAAGELCDGLKTSTPIPKSVMSGVQMVAAGDEASIILKTDGTVWSVGYNNNGQLGNGTFSNQDVLVKISF